MSAQPIRVSAEWLALREPADADARASDLVDLVRSYLSTDRPAVIHDLGCGTGSMGRWLAPLLAGPQHWVMYDRDADLLAHAAADMPDTAADGSAVTVETRQRDITRLERDDLADASLVTASALLDMLTADELDRFVVACAGAGCPALVTLSVVGRVGLSPADSLDERIAGAFDAHQRRTTDGRRLLGPDAAGVAVDTFTRLGSAVSVRASPWRLGADHAALTAEWITGWVGAACEQEPGLVPLAGPYLRRRLADAAAGRLDVTVHHHDLLAGPR